MGGYWAAELKYAGYDHLVLRGRSEKPVYVWIHNDGSSCATPTQLLGMNDRDTQQAILEELDNPNVKVISIGPAGENQVTWADLHPPGTCHAAARTGMGAVMGSKNVKAVAVRGTQARQRRRPGRLVTRRISRPTPPSAAPRCTREYSTVGTSWCEASYGRAGIRVRRRRPRGPHTQTGTRTATRRSTSSGRSTASSGPAAWAAPCTVWRPTTCRASAARRCRASCTRRPPGELRQDLLRGIKLVKLCQEMGIDEFLGDSNVAPVAPRPEGHEDHRRQPPGRRAAGVGRRRLPGRVHQQDHPREGVGDVFANGLLAAAKHLDAHTAPGPARRRQHLRTTRCRSTTAPCTASTRA